MRNISFAMTTEQVRNQTKTVTRRLGWGNLTPGTLLQPVVKAQGLKKGEKVEKIGGPIRVVRATSESLATVTPGECAREGFPDMMPQNFIVMFCAANRPCEPWWKVTRIEFEYVSR